MKRVIEGFRRVRRQLTHNHELLRNNVRSALREHGITSRPWGLTKYSEEELSKLYSRLRSLKRRGINLVDVLKEVNKSPMSPYSTEEGIQQLILNRIQQKKIFELLDRVENYIKKKEQKKEKLKELKQKLVNEAAEKVYKEIDKRHPELLRSAEKPKKIPKIVLAPRDKLLEMITAARRLKIDSVNVNGKNVPIDEIYLAVKEGKEHLYGKELATLYKMLKKNNMLTTREESAVAQGFRASLEQIKEADPSHKKEDYHIDAFFSDVAAELDRIVEASKDTGIKGMGFYLEALMHARDILSDPEVLKEFKKELFSHAKVRKEYKGPMKIRTTRPLYEQLVRDVAEAIRKYAEDNILRKRHSKMQKKLVTTKLRIRDILGYLIKDHLNKYSKYENFHFTRPITFLEE